MIKVENISKKFIKEIQKKEKIEALKCVKEEIYG